MTIEELQAEVEKLRTKNAQLLNEKKQVAGERDQIREQLEALTSERDEAARELHNIKVVQPRQDLIESKAAPGMAGTLWRELNHHFNVVNVDGRDMLQHKDGTPVTIAGKDETTGQEVQKPLAFDDTGLDALHEHKVIDGLEHLLTIMRPQGSGSPGNSHSGIHSPNSQPAPAKGAGYGLR